VVVHFVKQHVDLALVSCNRIERRFRENPHLPYFSCEQKNDAFFPLTDVIGHIVWVSRVSAERMRYSAALGVDAEAELADWNLLRYARDLMRRLMVGGA
jgi:hypothetical protein